MVSIKNTITITNKGRITIPAIYRRKLGLDAKGGVLDIHFDEATGVLVITRLHSIDELSSKLSSYVKPNTKSLTDVDRYYQKHRESRCRANAAETN